jgi:hypothetical protein
MNPSRLKISKPDILRYFDEQPEKIFRSSEIARILAEQGESWRLAQNTNSAEFIEFLQEAKLRELRFGFPHRPETRYIWGDVPFLEVLMTLKKDSFFSHYTAMRMHGLTEQIPKTIYINHEQRLGPQRGELAQERIDAAFRRPARTTSNLVEYGEVRICLINGANTGRLGVVEETVNYDPSGPARVRLTNIERTLIDIVVRPNYSGGVGEVSKAFRMAKDKVSVNRLTAMLQKLGYTYPYHQAIGFYLERAGYRSDALDLLRRFPMEFNFYLANAMDEIELVPSWKLFVPKGF